MKSIVPKMPKEYLGEYKKNCGYTKSTPREYTDKEIEWIKNLADMGYSTIEIADSVDRTPVAVSIKLKRISKKNDTYNLGHLEEKYELNRAFLEEIKPKSILDLYCGVKSFYTDSGIKSIYKGLNVTTNDIDENIEADYHKDAFKLICELYSNNKKYDLIDLDPYGSAYDSFDLAIKMAKKGLVITLGELGHKRWKRLDYVKYHYGINSLEEFTIENLIEEIIKIGKRNKKNLIVWKYAEWRNIGRVYFKVEDFKTTSQWDNKGNI